MARRETAEWMGEASGGEGGGRNFPGRGSRVSVRPALPGPRAAVDGVVVGVSGASRRQPLQLEVNAGLCWRPAREEEDLRVFAYASVRAPRTSGAVL